MQNYTVSRRCDFANIVYTWRHNISLYTVSQKSSTPNPWR